MIIFTLVFIFIFGSIIGSFLNVLIDRLPREEEITGRSYCDHCRRQLSWIDLVPILSFILLRGRCRYCRKEISWQYPLVEFLTGIIFVFVFWWVAGWEFGGEIDFNLFVWFRILVFWFIFSSLLVIFFADLKYRIIPDELQVGFFLGALLVRLENLSYWIEIFYWLAGGVTVLMPILIIYFLTRGKAMGFGDVKFAFNIGFFLGVKLGFLALYFAFIFGGFVSLWLIILRRKKLKSKIAFGPFLVFGLLFSFFYGETVVTWWLNNLGF